MPNRVPRRAASRAFPAVWAIVLAAASAEAGRPVAFEDLLHMRRVADAAISPDGRAVLYTVRQWETGSRDPQKKEQRSQVWRVSSAGGESTPLTFDEAGANAPAWSPDGRFISFLSRRGSGEARRPQIWILRTDGGDAVRLTDVTDRDGVSSYAWSPDGTRIAYVTRDPEPSDVETRTKRGDDRRVYEDEFRMSHLWVVGIASQTATRITEGRARTIRGDVSWSPDGRRIAFAAAPTPMLRDGRLDVYVVSLADKQVEKITANPGADSSPRWSPDGGTIAFVTESSTVTPGPDGLGTADPRQGRLALYDLRTRALADAFDPQFDVEPRAIAWTPDGRRLIFAAGRGAYTEAYSYEPAAQRYVRLTTGRVIALGTLSKDGSTTAFVMESSTQPPDVYVSDLSFAAPRRLTTANPQAAGFSLGESEVITWKNEGLDVEGVLLKPVGFKAGTRVPLLVVVHGGPAGVHLDNFRVAYGDGGQHWAGQGWAVLYPNPRGSTNYGERFMRANIPDWGGGDFHDIMAGVDALVAKGIADPDRLAIQGWSYGGYMTAWAITQTTRFKAAMVGAGITNLWSMYGTNDLPNYLAAFFGGIPSKETLPLYMERSAVTHAHTATTPTLILHGGNDERVPIGQPMELYRALKERGTPVELVFYPRQGHGLQEYEHQRDRLRRQFDWITKHTLEAGRKTTTQ
ncbi:MAG: prolyl oligopeptidase family serine peptidase [Vicinamibacterales bacterium]